MKSTNYFSHDNNAIDDPKIIAMRFDYGFEGYGMYWALIEYLASQTAYKLEKNKFLYRVLSKKFDIAIDKLESFINACINEYELLLEDDSFIWSKSLIERMQIRDAKIEKRKEAGKKGGIAKAENEQNKSKTIAETKQEDSKSLAMLKQNSSNAIAMPKQSLSNAIAINKEINKEKEKINKKEKLQEFEKARLIFPGTKRGLDVEFENFAKKNPDDWQGIIPKLFPAIERYNTYRQTLAEQGKFVPEPKNFQTWINQRCWTEEFPIVGTNGKVKEKQSNQQNEEYEMYVRSHTARGIPYYEFEEFVEAIGKGWKWDE